MRLFKPLIAFGLAVGLVFGGASVARTAGASDDARAFIESMAETAVESLTDRSVPRNERVSRFRRLFDERFAVQGIARFVLGRHWHAAAKAEREQYLRLFEDLIAASYVDRFADYAGETLRVSRVTQENGERMIVHSEIVRPNSESPIKVNWVLDTKDASFKVMDVTVEGLSMSFTLRDEYDSIIRQKDGKVAGLIEAMREKVAQLREALAPQAPQAPRP
jgi:phospholipid transport system substrate-binding protein